jgi:hypothetical protein
VNAPTAFLIDGTRYDVIDWYEPDASVGMFGEAGAWVCPASWAETGATAMGEVLPAPDSITLFVVAHDLSVYDNDNEPTGQTASVLA